MHVDLPLQTEQEDGAEGEEEQQGSSDEEVSKSCARAFWGALADPGMWVLQHSRQLQSVRFALSLR